MIATEATLENQWARLGAAFSTEPAARTPDLERCLIRTAEAMPDNPRLLPVVATWLDRYGDAVARDRLTALADTEASVDTRAALGLLLETADPGRFRAVLKGLAPVTPTRPLYRQQAANAALSKRAERLASDASRRWGLWSQPVDKKPDAIRPPAWVMRFNPTLRDRIDMRGDLRAAVLAALWHDPEARESKAALQRLLGASRRGISNAIENLETTQRIELTHDGRETRLCAPLPPAARRKAA
ncbi:MAG: hypothetical protein AAGG38_06220 [Planctomycetota bacterium]